MNKNFLKIIRDNLPEPIKYLLAPLFRNKLIRNKIYKQFSIRLYEREKLDEVAIQDIQLSSLKEILIYANKYVPYYTSLFKEIDFKPEKMQVAKEIEIIPLLTKELIRANFDKLVTTENVSGGHYVAITGGSSGEPLKVLLDYDCVFKENAFVNYFRSKLGYNLSDRIATFRGVEFEGKLWKYNPMQNELIFSPFRLSELSVSKYVNKINDYNPQFLNGYLSTIFYFARLLKENNLKLKYPLNGIFLISENIDKEKRAYIEDFFKVKTLTFYGHTECCIIAQELAPNEYMFDHYYGYTELIENENNKYSIVGTGFLNKTMPLIRYKTDDKCEILNINRVSILGRWNVSDFIIGIHNERVFHSAFNFHSEIFNNITGYQFIQSKKGFADLLIVVNRQFRNEEINLIKKEIDKKTKGVIDFNIRIVDQLILSKRGKFNMFINELK